MTTYPNYGVVRHSGDWVLLLNLGCLFFWLFKGFNYHQKWEINETGLNSLNNSFSLWLVSNINILSTSKYLAPHRSAWGGVNKHVGVGDYRWLQKPTSSRGFVVFLPSLVRGGPRPYRTVPVLVLILRQYYLVWLIFSGFRTKFKGNWEFNGYPERPMVDSELHFSLRL